MAKTTFLSFEQPIAELDAKIEDLRNVQDDSAVDISDEIAKPKPLPTPAFFVVNPALKILSRFSGLIPFPESLIFTISSLFSTFVVISIFPYFSIA